MLDAALNPSLSPEPHQHVGRDVQQYLEQWGGHGTEQDPTGHIISEAFLDATFSGLSLSLLQALFPSLEASLPPNSILSFYA